MSTVAQHLMTAEEFWLSPENRKHSSLIRGEVVESMPPGAKHGTVAIRLATRLGRWAESSGRRCVGAESGFILGRDPDIVRGPDLFYVRVERIAKSGIPEAFWNIAPDLAVEVVSPSESAAEVHEKVSDFLAAGTPRVWVVYPRSQEVVVYRSDRSARTCSANDVLEDQEILPGFSCRVAELFDE
ncbi:MAG: Uma2 family endonuclease [Planctomycetales bacterium]|nr:Uma2 family endonuclease [Planctomycetales bacterium]